MSTFRQVRVRETLLEVKGLSVAFDTPQGRIRAVDDVSFTLAEGETLGLVGESGSGKTVTSLAVMGLVPDPPGVIQGGKAVLKGVDLMQLSPRRMRRVRGAEISMIFQDPMTSLNPLLTVGRQLTEVLEVHAGTPKRDARRRAATALGEVGIPNPERRLDAYPHELSGGMRQRVMIAMALLMRPALLFADEPTTALDVTIQAQILDLMKGLQERHGMAIVLITHDLGVVAGTADRVNVMYAGKLVESADTRSLYRLPLHPYTRGLLASVPRLIGDTREKLFTIEGQPPDLTALPPGCAFAPRCTFRTEHCEHQEPQLAKVPGVRDPRDSACFETQTILRREEPAR